MITNTLFGKRIAGTIHPVAIDERLETPCSRRYDLHPGIDRTILDGLDEFASCVVAKISRSEVVYESGKRTAYSLEYFIQFGKRRDADNPFHQLALEFIHADGTEEKIRVDTKLASDSLLRKKTVPQLCDLLTSQGCSATEREYVSQVLGYCGSLATATMRILDPLLIKEETSLHDRNCYRFFIHPRFYYSLIPSAAVPYLKAVLYLAEKNGSTLLRSNWDISMISGLDQAEISALAKEYEEDDIANNLEDLQKIVIDTMKRLGVFNDSRFADMGGAYLGAVETLVQERIDEFLEGTDDSMFFPDEDRRMRTQALYDVLNYLEEISPRDFDATKDELRKNEMFVEGFERYPSSAELTALKKRLGL